MTDWIDRKEQCYNTEQSTCVAAMKNNNLKCCICSIPCNNNCFNLNLKQWHMILWL